MTKVRFRKFRDTKQIIAIFPEYDYPKWVNKKGDCMSYMHNGQHGECTYDYLLHITDTTNIDEYFDLLGELKSIGYNDLFIIP